MAKINAKCLRQLQALIGLPNTVEVQDKGGALLGIARINRDGEVNFGGADYENPSALRSVLIGEGLPTYKFFRFQNKTLSDWGVGR